MKDKSVPLFSESLTGNVRVPIYRLIYEILKSGRLVGQLHSNGGKEFGGVTLVFFTSREEETRSKAISSLEFAGDRASDRGLPSAG